MEASYEFVSRWEVPCSRDRLWRHLHRLLESEDPMVWWPAVHTESWEPGRLDLRATSAFGYQVGFTLTELHLDEPHTMTFRAFGDLAGEGVVRFVEAGPQSQLVIDWRVDVTRPWMERTSWLLRPVFALGHALVMRQGERRFAAWVRRSSAPRA